MKKDKRTKKEILISYLQGVLEELKKCPVKAVNEQNGRVIANSIINISK